MQGWKEKFLFHWRLSLEGSLACRTLHVKLTLMAYFRVADLCPPPHFHALTGSPDNQGEKFVFSEMCWSGVGPPLRLSLIYPRKQWEEREIFLVGDPIFHPVFLSCVRKSIWKLMRTTPAPLMHMRWGQRSRRLVRTCVAKVLYSDVSILFCLILFGFVLCSEATLRSVLRSCSLQHLV